MERRSYIKSAGALAGIAGVPSATLADSENWEHRMGEYQNARRIFKTTDSVTAFRQYLQSHAIPYGSTDLTTQVERPGDASAPSTEALDKADLQIWLTIAQPACSQYPNRYTGELTIDWSWQGVLDFGVLPNDAMGITFSDRHFYIPDQNGDEYWLDDHISYSNQSNNGIGFEVNDRGADSAGKLSVGTQLRWNDATNESADQRFLYAEYEHAYGGGSWGSMSFSIGTISINFDPGFDGGTWDTNQDHNDVPLKVSAADANCIIP